MTRPSALVARVRDRACNALAEVVVGLVFALDGIIDRRRQRR